MTKRIAPETAEVRRFGVALLLAVFMVWAMSAAFSVPIAILSLDGPTIVMVIGGNIVSLIASVYLAFRQKRLALVVACMPSILPVGFLVAFAWWLTRWPS